MGTAEVKFDKVALKSYFPFNNLSDDYLEKVLQKSAVISIPKGKVLFKRGDIPTDCFYLLAGNVDLCDEKFNIKPITAESKESRHALDNFSPHRASAIAKSDAACFTLSRDFLDLVMAWSQSSDLSSRSLANSHVMVEHLGVDDADEDEGDWMVNLLQSPLFEQVPPSNIQALFGKFESISAKAGDQIIRVGEEGDYFYVIQSGTARVITNIEAPEKGQIIPLKTGAFFGEDALIGDTTRNATIVMDTAGHLMRLSKADFKKLLQEPVIQQLSKEQVKEVICEAGDNVEFIDVRLGVEYKYAHVPDSINIPLDKLRDKKNQLDESKIYFVTSEGGRRSEVAVHILRQAGRTSYILKDSESYYN